MSYGDFVQEWKEIELTFEIENLSIEEIEDMYWARICNGEKKFAINNPISSRRIRSNTHGHNTPIAIR